MKFYPKIRSVLLVVNMAMLLVLLAGLGFLGVFETNLIRQTERELNTQAVFVAALYREAYAKALGQGQDVPLRILESEVLWQPLTTQLNIATTPLLDEQTLPIPVSEPATAQEKAAGSALVRILQDAQAKTLASIRVVNPRGTVVSSTNLQHDVSLMNRQEVAAALTGVHTAVLRKRKLTHASPSAFSISRRADFRVHVAHPITYADAVIGAVVLSRTPESLWQLVDRHKLELSLYVVVIVLLVWLLAVFTAHTIRNPLLAVVEQARRAKSGIKGSVTPLANPVTFEINELSQSVAQMAASLESRADYLMEYASHISHEFKSPVTALQGALELLLDHEGEMTAAEKHTFLANMHSDTIRLEQLVTRLLDFAKADLKKTLGAQCDLYQQLIWGVQEYRDKICIDLETQLTAQELTSKEIQPKVLIGLDSESMQTILRNLIENAMHAGADTVKLTYQFEGNFCVLHIMDNGDSISSANQVKIFQPFFTLHRHTGGTGLGLSIVQALLKNIGGDIRLSVSADTKAFILTLPCIDLDSIR